MWVPTIVTVLILAKLDTLVPTQAFASLSLPLEGLLTMLGLSMFKPAKPILNLEMSTILSEKEKKIVTDSRLATKWRSKTTSGGKKHRF